MASGKSNIWSRYSAVLSGLSPRDRIPMSWSIAASQACRSGGSTAPVSSSLVENHSTRRCASLTARRIREIPRPWASFMASAWVAPSFINHRCRLASRSVRVGQACGRVLFVFTPISFRVARSFRAWSGPFSTFIKPKNVQNCTNYWSGLTKIVNLMCGPSARIK